MNEKGQSKFEERLNQIIGSDDGLSTALDSLDDVAQERLPIEVNYAEISTRVVDPEGAKGDLVDDYTYTRNILYGLIERGTQALEGALMVARESEHPRAYEVTSTIMKNVSEMAKDLMSLQKTISEAKGGGAKAAPTPTTVTNIQNNINVSPDNIKDINGMLDLLGDTE